MKRWFFRGAHSVHDLTVHLIFIPKYRREIFKPKPGGLTHQEIVARLRELFTAICRREELNAYLVSIGVDENKPDHLHLVVAHPPTISVSQLVQNLKALSSRYWPKEIGGKNDGTLWSPSYFASSSGRSAAEYSRQIKDSAKSKSRAAERECEPASWRR